MKAKILFIALLIIAISTMALAEVPQLLNYQGKLMQANGTPVTDGTYSIVFAIYDVPNAGTPLWSETNASVQTKNGLFAVMLGSVTNLPANIFNQPNRFLGIKVGNNAEMLPRQQITTVAYSFRAALADNVVDGAITANKIADGAITSAKLSTGSITFNQLSTGIALPPGGIIMWTGQPDNIPAGWALCDGTNNTPDLRDKFIVGAGIGMGYSVGDTGGEATHTLTIAEIPSHSHSVLIANVNGYGGADGQTSGDGHNQTSHWSGFPTSTIGGNQPHENRPPYYALCFIMKLGY